MYDKPVNLLLPDTKERSQVEWASLVEELGYDGAWLVELWGKSALVEAAAVVERTNHVGIGIAIANVYSRSPAVLAMGAASIQRLSQGRFTLGTGVSTPTVIENLHGMEFDRPVRRAHESIELIKEFASGDRRVDYDGQIFSVEGFPSLDVSIPVYHAALGPANRRMVGRVADGWLPHLIPHSELEDCYEEIEMSARDADRDPDSISVVPYFPTAVAEDEEDARAAIRGHLAYYIGSGDGYKNAAAIGYPEAADLIAEAWRSGDRDAAVSYVTDEMVDDIGVAGTPESASDRLESLLDKYDIIDEALLGVPRQANHDVILETVQSIGPSTRGS